MNAVSAPEPEARTGPDVVICVDTNKHTHMAVALSSNGGWLSSLKLEAKRSGYQALMQWVAGFGSCPVFAVEDPVPMALVSAGPCSRHVSRWWR